MRNVSIQQCLLQEIAEFYLVKIFLSIILLGEMRAEFVDTTVISNICIHWVFLMSVAIKEVPYCVVTFCFCGPHTWTPSQKRPGKKYREMLDQRELPNTDVYFKLTLLCSFVYEIYFLSSMVLSLCNLNRFFHGCMWSLNPAFFLLMWKVKKKNLLAWKRKFLFNDWTWNVKEIHISGLILYEIPLDGGSSET